MEIRKSVCPYDCPDCCGLLVQVDGNRVIAVKGDPSHNFTRGTLCPKMANYERTVYSDRRLLTPLRRTGKKGAGSFSPISWDEALAEITDRWKDIGKTYGYKAILPYSYAGTMGLIQYRGYHALFNALGASELDRTICAPAKAYGWSAVMGATLPTPPQDAQKSDFIILWSLSMLATNIHFKHDIDIARKNGAKIWCIDTYETKTAQYADHFIRIRPGTDGALALGILHILEKENLIDTDFIKNHVLGWQELSSQVLPRYTLSHTEEITGVPASQISALAHKYARSRAPFIRLGSGLSRYANGAMTVRLICCLPATVGAYGKIGGGMLTSAFGSKAFDKDIVAKSSFRKDQGRVINMCQLGDALLDRTDPPIKAIYVYSSNPACTAPDQNRVIKGLLREDLFTVVHERFMTDTARYADIVLPATTSLEHDDIYYSYGHYNLQLGRAVIPPFGESRSNFQTACLLAKSMGLKQSFFLQSEEQLIEKIIKHNIWPLPINEKELLSGNPVELPLSENYKMDFRTPSGRIEILNPREAPELPDFIPPNGDDGEFWLINAPDPRILDSSFNEREELTRSDIMVLFMHPEDAGRLRLTDGQRVTAWNLRGQADFTLRITERTAPGHVVTEGVWWREHTKGCSVNVLTSQRLTDRAGGSTFYDVCVNIKAADL